MKIENIKLFRFISKKMKINNIMRSIENILMTIDPNTILIKVFSSLLKLIFIDKNPAIKLSVERTEAIRIEMNWEKEKILVRYKMAGASKTNRIAIKTEKINPLFLIIFQI